MRSLSEIETAVKRASRAIGFSWGISEEVGKSIRLLELFGLAGIKNLNQYYKEREIKKFENLNTIIKKNIAQEAFCPITLGVSFLDQINVLENLKKIVFKNVAYPIIFISFISRSSEIIGKKINVKIDEKKMLLNLNVNIISNFIDQEFPKIANTIEVDLLENEDNFTDDEWNNLYKLSEETFVEESDSLKEGAAGAGLTDND